MNPIPLLRVLTANIFALTVSFAVFAENLPFDNTNPFIWNNDANSDSFSQEFVMALASSGAIKLVAITESPHPYRTVAEDFQAVVTLARKSGLANIPDAAWNLRRYYKTALTRPASGNIDETLPINTVASRTILNRVLRLGTAAKPVVVGTGGSQTTVASAYLLSRNVKGVDRSKEFSRKIILLAGMGWSVNDVPNASEYNTAQDEWAAYINLTRLRVVLAAYSSTSWPMIWDFIDTLPDNPLTQHLRWKKSQWPYPDKLGDGDASSILPLILPTQGDYFTGMIRVSFDTFGPWPTDWTFALNTNAYQADLKIKIDSASDDIYLTGYNQSAGTAAWMNALSAAFHPSNSIDTLTLRLRRNGSIITANGRCQSSSQEPLQGDTIELYRINRRTKAASVIKTTLCSAAGRYRIKFRRSGRFKARNARTGSESSEVRA